MKIIKQIYINNISFYILIGLIILSVFGNYFPILFSASVILFYLFTAAILVDLLLLFTNKTGIISTRIIPDKLSNGDENIIIIEVKNNYGTNVDIKIIDELPIIFQEREFEINSHLKSGETKLFKYNLTPTTRGEYHFGITNIYAKATLGLFSKRYKLNNNQTAKVYPSFIQMRKYELLAVTHNRTSLGLKKVRRIGNQTEFEQIKEYVKGDDYRTINWRATARKNQLMVNQYQEEKAQEIYSIIDLSRTMKMPFNKMRLIDYAINTSLVLSNTSLIKEDKAGLITFSSTIHSIKKAERRNLTMKGIMELLYREKTNFYEADFEKLYVTIRRNINQRSLLFLYTNFEGFTSLKRQLKILRKINQSHVLVVVFFENSEISEITTQKANSIEDIYISTMAETNVFEKNKIVNELRKYGILSILTKPENITVNTINKYLEIKESGLI